MFKEETNTSYYFKEPNSASDLSGKGKKPPLKKNAKTSVVRPIQKTKPKFIPKTMKEDTDVKDNNVPEVESWMSTSAFTEKSKSAPTKKANYLDILNNLEDMETTASPSQDLPQREFESNLSQCGSLDDIVSILEALENEDKKSRKYFMRLLYYVQMNSKPFPQMQPLLEQLEQAP